MQCSIQDRAAREAEANDEPFKEPDLSRTVTRLARAEPSKIPKTPQYRWSDDQTTPRLFRRAQEEHSTESRPSRISGPALSDSLPTPCPSRRCTVLPAPDPSAPPKSPALGTCSPSSNGSSCMRSR